MLWSECWSTICQDERFGEHASLDPCCRASRLSPSKADICFVNACSLSAPPGRIDGP